MNKVCISWCWVIVFWITAFVNGYAASSAENTLKLIDYVKQEQNNLTQSIERLKTNDSSKDYLQNLTNNQALTALNQARIMSLTNFLTTQLEIQQTFNLRLKNVQQKVAPSGQTNVLEEISQLNSDSDLNQKSIQSIKDTLNLANYYQSLLEKQNHELELNKSKNRLSQQLATIKSKKQQLLLALDKLYESNHQFKLKAELETSNDFTANYQEQAKLLLNAQIINLTQYKISQLDVEEQLLHTDFLLLQHPDVKTLQTVADSYRKIINNLSDIEQSLKKMVTHLKAELKHLTDKNLIRQFSALLKIINTRLEEIVIQEQTLQEDLENHQQALKKQLATRQSLAEYGFRSWPNIIEQLYKIPLSVGSYLKNLVFKVGDNYLWQEKLSAIFLWLSLLTLALIAFGIHKLLTHNVNDKTRSRLSGHLYEVILVLIDRNLPYLTVFMALLIVLYQNQVNFSNYQLLFNVIIAWFVFRVLILIARLVLLERLSDVSGKDVRLYYRVKWLLLAGGWATTLMIISHELPLSLLLQDMFNRLFMLFLLITSVVSLKSKEMIGYLLEPMLQNKKNYFRNATRLLVILIPLTLFTTAILGLIGYINLAWTLSRYQMQILLVITGYVLLRGLLFDAMELLYEWLIRSVQNGWLWIEVILKPLDKIMRVTLVLISLFLLCQWLGLTSDLTMIDGLYQLLAYALINTSGIYITPKSIIEFTIVLAIFIWMAKWTREFCYRWLYRDIKDSGVRNSVSAFTQYALVLIGGFITLRVLGFDFSGMSMVIGGLAVGLGFGLRDFASNVVGGLMLLIERPVREGDLITLGDYEGQVSHIGLRSMRVCSWDNTEILIPNAETFNKPFVNWTHQNNIVRTVFPIKVNRDDDPTLIQQIIVDILANMPEVAPDPPAQVFLKQIEEALIEFEIRYFIDVQRYTRFEIRSKILFAITQAFKQKGVKAPIPPIKIELNKEHGSIVDSTPCNE